MSFDELLKAWNKGIMRGAPRRFANAIGVSETYLSSWRSGRNRPGEEQIPKIAKALGVAEDEARGLFFPRQEPSTLLAIAKMLLADHQRVEPHHPHLCETCKVSEAAIRTAEGR